MNYRIVKLTFDDKLERYIIQRQSRLFGIGPLIWKNFYTDYGTGGCEYNCWTFFRRFANKYSDYSYTENELRRIIKSRKNKVITNSEIVNYFES